MMHFMEQVIGVLLGMAIYSLGILSYEGIKIFIRDFKNKNKTGE